MTVEFDHILRKVRHNHEKHDVIQELKHTNRRTDNWVQENRDMINIYEKWAKDDPKLKTKSQMDYQTVLCIQKMTFLHKRSCR